MAPMTGNCKATDGHGEYDGCMPRTINDNLPLLRHSSVFAPLRKAVLERISRQMETRTVDGGQTLFRAGETAAGLYLLRSGSIGLFRPPQAGGEEHLAGIVGNGETLGVTSLLLDQPYNINARALRDSELLFLSRKAWDRLIHRHPRVMLGSARAALQRLLDRDADEPRIQPRTFAILPFDASVNVRALAEALRLALQPFGQCLLVDAALGKDREPGWFAEQEERAHFVLYLDEGRDEAWRDLCRRQADALLPAVQAGRRPGPWLDAAHMDEHADLARPRHLLLLHSGADIVAGAAARWGEVFEGIAQVHHIRHLSRGDIERVARLLARRSAGLVLSGGGARAFAAIGLIRALRECGFHVDRVGGTSMGAIVAAGVAREWDNDAMRAHFHDAFVKHKPLSDWTFPLVALLRGERASRLFMQHFGKGDISDLALPFFCVSADLTSGMARIHRDGPLWRALRAASSIPGLLPPVLHDGHVLVDGGIINDLPVDVMYDHGVSRILACDIRAEGVLTSPLEQAWSPGLWQQWRQRHKQPGIGSLLLRSGMVNAETGATARRRLATWLFAPPMEDIGLLDFDAFDRAVELGYRYGMQLLPELTT